MRDRLLQGLESLHQLSQQLLSPSGGQVGPNRKAGAAAASVGAAVVSKAWRHQMLGVRYDELARVLRGRVQGCQPLGVLLKSSEKNLFGDVRRKQRCRPLARNAVLEISEEAVLVAAFFMPWPGSRWREVLSNKNPQLDAGGLNPTFLDASTLRLSSLNPRILPHDGRLSSAHC